MTKVNDINFNWSFDGFEIRTRATAEPDMLMRHPIEIVKWNAAHNRCFVIAMWDAYDEGYHLQFIGGRPFEHITAEEIAIIWPQLQAAQKMLDAYFEAWEEGNW